MAFGCPVAVRATSVSRRASMASKNAVVTASVLAAVRCHRPAASLRSSEAFPCSRACKFRRNRPSKCITLRVSLSTFRSAAAPFPLAPLGSQAGQGPDFACPAFLDDVGSKGPRAATAPPWRRGRPGSVTGGRRRHERRRTRRGWARLAFARTRST